MTAGPARPRLAFLSAASIACLTTLDLGKINVALPTIRSSLEGSTSELQLLVAGYILVFGVVLVPAGRLGDAGSRRLVVLLGLVGFGLTSALCALAPTAPLLLLGRLLQGASAGFLMPQVWGLVHELFTGRERALAFGRLGATVGVGTALGPALGGALVAIGDAVDSWRWIFWVNVPLAALLLVTAAVSIPRTPRETPGRLDLDPVGALLLALAVAAVMLPFVAPAEWDARRWLALPVAAALAIAFASWERRRERVGGEPLLRLALLRLPGFRTGLAVGFASFAGIAGLLLVQTLFLQEGEHWSPFAAGLVTAPFAIASAISSWFTGALTYRLGARAVLIGVAGLLVGCLLLLAAATWATPEALPWCLAGALAVTGAGGGINLAANQTVMLAAVPARAGGVAASVIQVVQRIGTAVGTAIVSSVFFGILVDAHGEPGAHAHGFRMALLLVIGSLVAAVAIAATDNRRLADPTPPG